MSRVTAAGNEYEYQAEAEGGITLSEGVKWWGTRVRYRRVGVADRRWTKFLLVDVHPFDTAEIEHAVAEHSQGRMTAYV